MKYLWIIAFAFLLSNPIKADDAALVHAAAHVGLSYLINDFGYTALHDGLKVDKRWALVASAAFTLTVGAAWKIYEIKNGGTFDSVPRAMTENTIGLGLSSLTITVWRW